MKSYWKSLTLNKRFAAAAFILGLLAVIAGSPYRIDEGRAKDLLKIIRNEEDHVSAEEVGRWIMERKSGLRVVDVRDPQDFDAYHIPSALNIPLDSLLDAGLSKNETIVLYSEGGIHAAQAWLLMKAQGYQKVYSLKGGLEEWMDVIIHPTISNNPSQEERASFEKNREMTRYFGGRPSILPPNDKASGKTTSSSVKKAIKEGC
jgi:hypothetical protein